MKDRNQLQALLESILGSEYVYFQPTVNVQMQYPAITYYRDDIDTKFAGNLPYSQTNRYEVKVIYRDPECDVANKIAALPLSSFDRQFIVDTLYHDVFTLYF